MRSHLLILILSLCTVSYGQLIYIKAGKLFNGDSEQIQKKQIIQIEDGKIIRLGPEISIPQNAQVLDLDNNFVLPGLIDTHTHIVLHAGNYDDQILRESHEYRALAAVPSARAMLSSGITTIRDMGNEGAGFADIALRDAIEAGHIEGPRILASIMPVTTTGSYNLLGFSPYFTPPQIAYQGDGPSELQKQVRKLVQLGADVIKVYVESFEKKEIRQDILSGAINYTAEELDMIVREARRSGVQVAAHVYSDEAAQMAINANVHSIEHGLYISKKSFEQMAKKGIYYVPTLMVYQLWRDGRILQPVSDKRKTMLTKTVELHTETFKTALTTPVKIAFGTDTFALPGTNYEELLLMVEYGMAPKAALHSATGAAADLLGLTDLTGRIRAGLAADLIAIDGNPAENIAEINKVLLVMKNGHIFRNDIEN